MLSTRKITSLSKDPQNWILVIGMLSVLGLTSGAFEPVDIAADTPSVQAFNQTDVSKRSADTDS
jgi:hypothetical protein